MSRGPGWIQRRLAAAFDADPCAVLNAGDMIELAFPGVEHLPKHKVATLRAARKLAESSPRFETYIGAPRAGELLLANATNTRSLALGRVFQHFAGARPISDCVAFLDNPETEAFREAQANGFIDLLARRNALWAEGRDEEAEVLSARIRERIEQAKRERSVLPSNHTAAA